MKPCTAHGRACTWRAYGAAMPSGMRRVIRGCSRTCAFEAAAADMDARGQAEGAAWLRSEIHPDERCVDLDPSGVLYELSYAAGMYAEGPDPWEWCRRAPYYMDEGIGVVRMVRWDTDTVVYEANGVSDRALEGRASWWCAMVDHVRAVALGWRVA